MATTRQAVGSAGVFLRLVKAEMVKAYTLALRYPLETAGSIVVLYLMFLAIFLGGNFISISGQALFGDGPELRLLGFLYYFATISGLSNVPGAISGETQKGTIINLFTGQVSAATIMVAKSIATFFQGLVLVGLLYLFCSLTIGSFVAVNLLSLLIIIMAYIGMIGLGLCFGGLTLHYKKTANILNLVNLALLLLAIRPPSSLLSWSNPFTYGINLVRDIAQGRTLEISLVLGLLLVALLYLTAGTLVFRFFEKKAKRAGTVELY